MLETLREALTSCLSTEATDDTALLFSGGLDSSLLAALALSIRRLPLYTVGLPGSHDLKAAERGAMEMGLPWTPIILDEGAIRQGVVFLRDDMGISDPVTVSFELPLGIACARVPQGRIMTGQGADELFGGYARYRDMREERGDRMLRDQEALLATGWPRERDMAARLNKVLVCPYLCPDVVQAARSFPAGDLIGPAGNKLPLRHIAESEGISAAWSPKKAAQYGSGVMNAMKRMASRDGLPLGEWVLEARP